MKFRGLHSLISLAHSSLLKYTCAHVREHTYTQQELQDQETTNLWKSGRLD